jgi:hypothetical protein
MIMITWPIFPAACAAVGAGLAEAAADADGAALGTAAGRLGVEVQPADSSVSAAPSTTVRFMDRA